MTFRTVLLLIIHFFLIHRAESFPSTDKLIAWVKENSEIFILLKHWNELPLISTSWKRLKDSPEVIEDQRIFLETLESMKSLHLSSEELYRNKSRSATVDSIGYTKNDSVIEEKNSLTNNDLSVTNNVKNLETELTRFNQTIEVSGNTSETNQTSVLCGSRIESNKQSSSEFSIFLEEFREEKKLIRSQLVPLNYMFEKLKRLEEDLKIIQINFQVKQKNQGMPGDSSSSGPFWEEFKFVNKSEDLSVLLSKQIEPLNKTTNKNIEQLRSNLLALEESMNSTKKELLELRSKVDNLSIRGLNSSTEEAEYCPYKLDEMECAEIGDSCYCFSKHQKNWNESFKFCQKNRMFLISFESKQETELVTNYIKESDLPKDFYWTSGSDEGYEGNWVWMSSQQNVSYMNWRSNQPDGSRKENCLYLHSRDDSVQQNMKMNSMSKGTIDALISLNGEIGCATWRNILSASGKFVG